MTVLGMGLLVVLLVVLQQRIYTKYWDRGLDMKLSFSAKEAFEGERLVLTEELTNAKPLPLPWVNAKFQMSKHLLFLQGKSFRVSDDVYQNDMFSVNMYQRITRRQEFLCGRRGYYRVKSMDLGSSNLMISDKLVKRLDCDAELTVLPRLIPFEEMDIICRQIYGDIEVKRFTNPDPFAFRGIREYRYEDDFRFINFKASAQTGNLMVNLYAATASQELVILLNLQDYSDWCRDEVFEDAIRLAASVAGHFSAMGLAVGVRSNGRDVTTGSLVQVLPGSGNQHFHTVLEKLARIDLGLDREAFAPAVRGLEQTEPCYLLISSYHGRDLLEAYGGMLERGLEVRWIMPALADTIVRLPEDIDITRWEVTPHDPSALLDPAGAV